jgi:dihydropteroate synthase
MRAPRPLVMGIVNVTPDSFSDGGRHLHAADAVARGLQLVDEGADLLDLGAESTRPGAAPVPLELELTRLRPVLEGLRRAGCRAPISVDTSKAAVARAALAAGASWVNDVSALQDPEMASVCAASGCDVVLMHRRGDPTTMQRDTRYADLIGEIEAHLLARAALAERAGIDRARIVLDAGLGFGKSSLDNPRLIAATPRLRSHGYRVLVGASRKRFIGELTGVGEAPARVHGSVGAALAAAALGADIVRVHDVAATVQALAVFVACVGGAP